MELDLSQLSVAARGRCQSCVSSAELQFVEDERVTDWAEDLVGPEHYQERLRLRSLNFLCDLFFSLAYEICNSEIKSVSEVRSCIEQTLNDLKKWVFREKWPIPSCSLAEEPLRVEFAQRSRYWIESDERWITLQTYLRDCAELEAAEEEKAAQMGASAMREMPSLTPGERVQAVSTRHRIESFLEEASAIAGAKLNKKEIWAAAGYKDDTAFVKYQNGSKTSNKAAKAFGRILALKPSEFVSQYINKP